MHGGQIGSPVFHEHRTWEQESLWDTGAPSTSSQVHALCSSPFLLALTLGQGSCRQLSFPTALSVSPASPELLFVKTVSEVNPSRSGHSSANDVHGERRGCNAWPCPWSQPRGERLAGGTATLEWSELDKHVPSPESQGWRSLCWYLPSHLLLIWERAWPGLESRAADHPTPANTLRISHLCRHQNRLEGSSLTTGGPVPGPDSVGLEWGLRVCILKVPRWRCCC